MNALNRRIALLFVVISMVVVGPLAAQNVASGQETQQPAAAKQAQIAQKQAQAAQKQAEAAQRQVEVAKTQALVAALAAPDAPNAPVAPVAPARAISFNGPWSLGSGGAGSVLVIPTAELKTEELAAMTEDMSIMSRIFEKNLEQARIPTSRGGLFVSSHDSLAALLGGAGGTIQSMYLQGYGALYLMKVDFPLSPPPQTEQKQEEETKKEETDPVWQQMRKEMYEPQEPGRRNTKEPQVEYDAEKVENLKTALVKALKHAANIRSLKQDELVILAVTGTGGSAGGSVMVATNTEVVAGGHSQIVQQQSASSGSSQIVLVIRAKKSDIDSFAKNGDYEQFRQRIQLFSCPCLGSGAGRGDPFGRYF